MQELIDTFNQKEYTDIFSMWEEELKLRNAIRKSELSPTIVVNSMEQLYLLYRSLYYCGQKTEFWTVIFNNLHQMPVIKWIGALPDELLNDFYSFIPWYIKSKKPVPEKLLFLINIYRTEYVDKMTAVVNSLDLEGCRFLLSRTGNSDFRRLLREREKQLLEKQRKFHYGFIETPATNHYPTIMGDKIKLSLETLEIFEQTGHAKFSDPFSAERFELLLQGCELLFRCGMVEDCLAVLFDVYEDYRENNRLTNVLEDEKIYRLFFRLLRCSIPVYALLLDRLHPSKWASDIYKQYFPRIRLDTASLQYLTIYETIQDIDNNSVLAVLYEVFLKSRTIQHYRPYESPLILEKHTRTDIEIPFVDQILEMVEQKKVALPHEAYILLEYLLFLVANDKLKPESAHSSAILKFYIELWHWLPSTLFINDSIINTIGRSAESKYRKETEHILQEILVNKREKLQEDIQNRPDIFKKKAAGLRREILLANFLGVLS